MTGLEIQKYLFRTSFLHFTWRISIKRTCAVYACGAVAHWRISQNWEVCRALNMYIRQWINKVLGKSAIKRGVIFQEADPLRYTVYNFNMYIDLYAYTYKYFIFISFVGMLLSFAINSNISCYWKYFPFSWWIIYIICTYIKKEEILLF